MTAQNDFISNAAHQLRNPIAGVLALAEATRASPTLEEARKRSMDLLDAARGAADLSAKLLLLERAKTISPASSMESFDLSSSLNDWADDMRPGLPDGVRLTVAANAGPDELTGDPVMLREAIRNLVQNAVLHGGPDVSEIVISAVQDGSNKVIAVQDDGAGVPPPDLPKIRERFKQGGAGAGSGLGVSIAEAVAQGHGGSLELASDGSGFTASLILPRRV